MDTLVHLISRCALGSEQQAVRDLPLDPESFADHGPLGSACTFIGFIGFRKIGENVLEDRSFLFVLPNLARLLFCSLP